MSSVIVPVISVIDGCWVRLSYTYSLVFAADMYATVFKLNPLDPVRGAKYREAILRPGGSREEDDSLKVTDLFSVSPWGTAASNTIDTSTGIPRAAAELRGVRARTIRTRRVQPLSLIVMDYHSSNRYIRSAPPFCIRMSSALRCIILATLHAKQHSEDTPVRPTLGVSRSITCGQCPTGYLQGCGERVFDVRGLPRALPADSGRISERLVAGGHRMLGLLQPTQSPCRRSARVGQVGTFEFASIRAVFLCCRNVHVHAVGGSSRVQHHWCTSSSH